VTRDAGWDGCQRAADVLRKLGVAPDRLETLLTAEVGHTQSEVVYEENTLELHHYEPDERRHGTPILVVYALVNRPYILDLQPDRSVVRRLLEGGFDVYLLDWGEPTRLDASLDMGDYVGRYLDNVIDATCEHAGVEAVHLLGYCMGGTMALAHTALRGERVRTLGLMATPVAFDGTGGILERWATYFDPEVAVETLGNMPAELLSVEFSMMNPVDQYLTKYVQLYENIEDDAFVENFARMERWIWDGVDVAGAAFAEFVGEVYKDNNLVAGEYTLDGRPVHLDDVDVPLLTVVGEYDHIVPAESSRPVVDLVGSEDTRLVEFPRGHIGISVSGKAHEQLWPEVCGWYAARDAASAAGADADGGAAGDSTGDEGADEATAARAAVRAVAERGRVAAGARGNGAGGDEATTDGTADNGADTTDDGVDTTGGAATSAGTETPADVADVEAVEGVGPTYAGRLREAGIETVADLAEYDARLLAAVADAPEGRTRRWLERVGNPGQ
jgi:polyhydroxyalkanoate synthase